MNTVLPPSGFVHNYNTLHNHALAQTVFVAQVVYKFAAFDRDRFYPGPD